MIGKKKGKRMELIMDYWVGECQTCTQHHNYDCDDGCIFQNECEQTHKQIVALIEKSGQVDGI